MKKIFFLLLLASASVTAQFTPTTNVNYIKYLKTPPVSTSFADSLLLYRESNKIQYMMPISEFGKKFVPLSGTISGFPVTGNVNFDNAGLLLTDGFNDVTIFPDQINYTNTNSFTTIEAGSFNVNGVSGNYVAANAVGLDGKPTVGSVFGGVNSQLTQDQLRFGGSTNYKEIIPGTNSGTNQVYQLPDNPAGTYTLATVEGIGTGFVPYTGATTDVNLNNKDLLNVKSAVINTGLTIAALNGPLTSTAGVVSAATTTGSGSVIALQTSPGFLGSPTAPTAAASTNTTQIATTAFVQQETANDVAGPASATDNAVARYDSTTGKVIQNSNLILDDDGGLTFAGQASPTYGAGKLVYDTTNESLTFYNNDANVALQMGQELWIPVRNVSGSTIANGSAVYINGTNSGLPTIALAQANAAATTVVAGLTTESIANNSNGYVTAIGTVRGLNTSSFVAGNIFLSATVAGGLTQTAPTSPNYRYRVGFVTNVNATTGTISVTPTTAALGNGSAFQVSGINASGTQLYDYRTRDVIDNTTTVSSINSVAEQKVFSQAVPANTLVNGSFLNLNIMLGRTNTNANATIKVYVNDTDDLTTPLQIGQYTIPMSTLGALFDRKFKLASNTLISKTTATANQLTEAASTGAPTSVTYTVANQYYWIVSVTLNNGADIISVEAVNLKSSK